MQAVMKLYILDSTLLILSPKSGKRSACIPSWNLNVDFFHFSDVTKIEMSLWIETFKTESRQKLSSVKDLVHRVYS